MKTLLILRHGKSSWANLYLADHDRPLKARGKRDAPRMGRLLKEEELTPDLIISSTAERALATAELAALACDYEGEIETTRDFYHAAPEAYLERLQELPDEIERVMVVGHNPGLAELVAELTGEAERFPTAALAQVALPIERWGQLDDGTEGELVNLWRPKELPG
ncbi:MAG: histidine phosphatase family protein [Candidatus Promineifilaceae bacterium]|nr:histidine phosphatase family protein [Candidatus Promineifilaceae bacterium]